MTCVSVYENTYRGDDGEWVVYLGMDQRDENEIASFEDYDEALERAKDEGKDVVLVVESGEMGGYTHKFEKSWPGYEEVSA